MKFTIVAVGKLKEKFWTAACAEYLKRMQPYGKTEVREIADIDPARAGGVDAAPAGCLNTIPLFWVRGALVMYRPRALSSR